MKKIFSLLFVAFLSLGLVACNKEKTTPKTEDTFIANNIYTDYAVEQLKKINEHISYDENHEEYPNMIRHTKDGDIANLWDFGAYFTGVIKTYKITQTEEIQAYYDQAFSDLEWYKALNRDDDYLVYSSKNGNEVPAFYDDNVWLVIGLLESYEYTKNEEHLKMAEDIQEWIYDSWQTAFGGGLLWREFHADPTWDEKISRNTCINAPAAYAAARFYQLTGSDYHLEWAEQIFTWTEEHLFDTQLNVYLDNIDEFGNVENMIFTYNSGVMISAASLLYNLTNNDHYQDHALLNIAGAKDVMSKKHMRNDIEGDFYKDNTWFNMYLFQGYLDATRYLDETELAHQNMQEAIKAFNFVYPRYKDYHGLALQEWDASNLTQSRQESFRPASLHAAGNLESMTVFAEYYRENPELLKTDGKVS